MVELSRTVSSISGYAVSPIFSFSEPAVGSGFLLIWFSSSTVGPLPGTISVNFSGVYVCLSWGYTVLGGGMSSSPGSVSSVSAGSPMIALFVSFVILLTG